MSVRELGDQALASVIGYICAVRSEASAARCYCLQAVDHASHVLVARWVVPVVLAVVLREWFSVCPRPKRYGARSLIDATAECLKVLTMPEAAVSQAMARERVGA